MCMPAKSRSGRAPCWGQLYDEAAPQAGYFTMAQADAAGYSSPLVEYYIRIGRVERVARGIFRIVHFPPGEHEDLIVVWLWSGREGIFSHQTALLLHQVSDALPAQRHVTVPSAWAKRRLRVPPGVVLHYRDLAKNEIEWNGSIPVTTPLRSLIDCTLDHVSPELVKQARRELLARGIVRATELKKRLAANASR